MQDRFAEESTGHLGEIINDHKWKKKIMAQELADLLAAFEDKQKVARLAQKR
jgi:hypothetical protein